MSDGQLLQLSFLLILLSVPAIMTLAISQDVDILSPGILFSIYIFLGYVSPLSSFLAGTDVFTRLWPFIFDDFQSSLSRALLLITIGVTGFYIGYYVPAMAGRPMPMADRSQALDVAPLDRRRLLQVGLAYSILGPALFLMGVVLLGGPGVLLSGLGDRTRLFEGINYFIQSINLLLTVSFLWWGQLLSLGKRIDFKFILYTSISLLLCALLGNKSTIFIFSITLAIMYHVMYKKINVLILIVASILFFIFLTFYALILREYFMVGQFITLDISGLGIRSVVEVIQTEFGGNFIQLQVLTVLAERVPIDLPYQEGATYLTLLALPVPRAWWPDKPLPSTGTFTLAFWPEAWLNTGTTLPPGLIGEQYMNFGIVGIFFGMLMFGLAYRCVRWRVLRCGRSILDCIGYALLLGLMLHYLRGDFAGGTVQLALLFGPTVVGYAWSRRGVRTIGAPRPSE